MPAYAIAHLRSIDFNEDIAEYLRRIDATLPPFGGRFLVHGRRPIPLEGEFEGDLVIVAFDSLERARAWYASPAYQAILPLRTRNARGETFLVEGVPPDYRAAGLLEVKRAAVGGAASAAGQGADGR
ncbi:MAG TPA: DUF1330 domain-containing protein [Burkholderiaceae bacterium]|nr:DUF1330 domain-containing protein [Burkholderiaceae bacterium]